MGEMNARKIAALIAAGTVSIAPAGSTCNECAGFNDVMDGLRKASKAKYVAKGQALCGNHVIRIAEDRECVWNGTSYQRVTPGTGKREALEAKRAGKRAADKAAKAQREAEREAKNLARPCIRGGEAANGRIVCLKHWSHFTGDAQRCEAASTHDASQAEERR